MHHIDISNKKLWPKSKTTKSCLHISIKKYLVKYIEKSIKKDTESYIKGFKEKDMKSQTKKYI